MKGEKNLEELETLLEWKNHLLTDMCILDTLAVDNREIETQHDKLAVKQESSAYNKSVIIEAVFAFLHNLSKFIFPKTVRLISLISSKTTFLGVSSWLNGVLTWGLH